MCEDKRIKLVFNSTLGRALVADCEDETAAVAWKDFLVRLGLDKKSVNTSESMVMVDANKFERLKDFGEYVELWVTGVQAEHALRERKQHPREGTGRKEKDGLCLT